MNLEFELENLFNSNILVIEHKVPKLRRTSRVLKVWKQNVPKKNYKGDSFVFRKLTQTPKNFNAFIEEMLTAPT